MKKPFSLLAVLVLGLSALLLAGVQTANAQYTPDEQLSVTISPSNATIIDVDQYIQFTASASGGEPPYSYQWYANDSAITGATTSSFTFTPDYPSTYDVSIVVTDASEAQARSNATSVTVNQGLSIDINQETTTTKVNQPVQFTVLASGGTPPYAYQWHSRLHASGEIVASATSSTFIFTPTAAGTYTIYVTVEDSVNSQVELDFPLMLTVTALAEATPSPSATPATTAAPTPTSTSSPTPTPILDTKTVDPINAVIIIASVIAIAVLVLLREQHYRRTEKPETATPEKTHV